MEGPLFILLSKAQACYVFALRLQVKPRSGSASVEDARLRACRIAQACFGLYGTGVREGLYVGLNSVLT